MMRSSAFSRFIKDIRLELPDGSGCFLSRTDLVLEHTGACACTQQNICFLFCRYHLDCRFSPCMKLTLDGLQHWGNYIINFYGSAKALSITKSIYRVLSSIYKVLCCVEYLYIIILGYIGQLQ